MAIVLTTPVPAPHIPGIYNPGVSLPVGQTTPVDVIPLTVFQAAKWLITLTDTLNERTRMFEVSAVHRDGKPPLHTLFGDVGDRIPAVVNVSETYTDFILNIINNDTVELRVSVMRLQVI